MTTIAELMKMDKKSGTTASDKPASHNPKPAPKPKFNFMANKQAANKSLNNKLGGITQPPKGAEVANPPKDNAAPTPEAVSNSLAASGELNNSNKYTFSQQVDELAPEDVEQMQAHFTILRDSLDHPEQIADAVAGVLKHMKQNAALVKLLEPEDYEVLVNGIRGSYAVTVTKKATNRTKRAKSTKAVGEVLSELDGLDFSL